MAYARVTLLQSAESSRGVMASKPKTAFQELCHGIPVETIARWCCVSLSIAQQFKSGTRAPSAPSLELFSLHLEERIVPPEWHGFTFRSGTMWDPSGKAFTHGQLRAYHTGLQLLREWARSDTQRTRAVDAFFRSASTQRVSTRHSHEPRISRCDLADAPPAVAENELEEELPN